MCNPPPPRAFAGQTQLRLPVILLVRGIDLVDTRIDYDYENDYEFESIERTLPNIYDGQPQGR